MLQKQGKRVQPRLDPDVVDFVLKSAAENGRTPVREVNHALRKHYSAQNVMLPTNMIPPTYWTKKQREDYERTGVYPGTENDAQPVIHSIEQRALTLHGGVKVKFSRLAPEHWTGTHVETIKFGRKRRKR